MLLKIDLLDRYMSGRRVKKRYAMSRHAELSFRMNRPSDR